MPAPRFTHRPITEWPTNPSCALFAYPRNTQLDSSPRALLCGPMADPRTGPPSTRAFAPTHSGPSSRAPARTSAPLSSTTGPFRTSKITPGSTAASCSAIAAGSPSTVLPAGIGSVSPSSARRSSASRRSRAGTRSYTPCSTIPATSIAAACGCGPSHVAPGPTPHPTVTPQLVSRNAPSGSAGASPCGAKVVEPITAGPVTGRLAATRGMSPSTKPARWGRAKIAVVSLPTNVSQRSRIRYAPARSSDSGRAPANGAQARVGSGSNRYSAWPEDWGRAGEEGVIAAAPAP